MNKFILSSLSSLILLNIHASAGTLQHTQLDVTQLKPAQTFANSEAFSLVTPNLSQPLSVNGENAHEHYDPVSGNLKLIYNDIVLPGDGGLDIVIRRLYDHLNPAGRDFMAPGVNRFQSRWDVGMNTPLLIAPSNLGGVTKNLSFLKGLALRLPNGEVSKLIIKKINPGVTLTTTNNWQVYLEYHAPKLTVWVTSPTGTVYYYEEPVTGQGYIQFQNGGLIQYIRDKHGNMIRFYYSSNRLTQIKASDGRLVNVSYATDKNSRVVSFSANGKTWKYYFTGTNIKYWGDTYQLTKVIRPDNKFWQYSYDTHVNYSIHNHIRFGINLKEMISPLGLRTRYQFSNSQGVSAVLPPEVDNPLMKKQVILNDKTSYSWSYAYSNGGAGSNMGYTNITGPQNKAKYSYHVPTLGSNPTDHSSYQLQNYGLIKAIQITDKKGKELRHESFEYPASLNHLIATNSDKYSTCVVDHLNLGAASTHCTHSYQLALLGQHTIKIPTQGTYLTRYSDYDTFGRPHHIEAIGDNNKIRNTTLTYFTNTNKNIFGGVASKQINNYLIESNQFDEKGLGDVVTHTKQGITTHFKYYPNGNLKSATDANQHTTTYQDYKLGKPQLVTYANHSTLSQTVSADGIVLASTDANNHTTHYLYDKLNRLVQIKDPRNIKTNINYDDEHSGLGGNIKTQGNLQITTHVDALGREIEIDKTDLNTHITYRQLKTYDQLNRLVFKSYFYDVNTTDNTKGDYYQYDGLNRPISHCAPLQNSLCTHYDYHAGHKTVITNPKQQATTITWQAYANPTHGSIIQTQQPEGITTQIQRDVFGNVTAVKQGELTRSYQYHPNTLLLKSETNPEIGTTLFDYDGAGNLITKTKSGLTTHYHYTSVNQVDKVDYSDGAPSLLKSYYPGGQLKSITKGEINKSDRYDANDNLVDENFIIDNKTFKLQYRYDDHNQLSHITYPNNQIITYAPNAFGQATKVGDYIQHVRHFANGMIESMHAANGVTTTTHLNQRLLPTTISISTQSDTIGRTYQYDNNNNVTHINNTSDPSYNLSLGYDNVNRLITANGKWGQGHITYDANSNIISKQIGKDLLNYRLNKNGLLDSVDGSATRQFSYDNLGNVTSNGKNNFIYTLDGNLISLEDNHGNVIANYKYDDKGQRLIQQTRNNTIYSLYNHDGTLLYQEDTNGNSSNYFYLNHNKVAQLTNKANTATVTYFHSNLLGSPIAATNANGMLLWQQHYQPFGSRLSHCATQSNQQWYTGKVEDNDSGLMYYAARYYDAEIGRFMAMDPAAFNPKQPFSFNRYAYANNNPYLFIDPTGMWSVVFSIGTSDWAIGIQTSHGFIGIGQATFDGYAKIANNFWNNATLGLVGEDDGKTHNYSYNFSVTGGYGRSASYGMTIDKKGVSFYNAYGYGQGVNVNIGFTKTFGHAPSGFNAGIVVSGGSLVNYTSTTGLSKNGAYETIGAGFGGGAYIGSLIGYSSRRYSWTGISNGMVSIFRQLITPTFRRNEHG